MQITATYRDRGLSGRLDTKAMEIAERYGARFVGSGYCLASSLRDIEFSVQSKRFPRMAQALTRAGFRVT